MRNPKKLQVFLPLMLAATLTLGMFFGFKLRDKYQLNGKNVFQVYNGGNSTLQEIMQLINTKYVDTVNDSVLRSAAIKSILSHLDPHSIYIPPSELSGINDDLEGDFDGIGVEFVMLRDTLNVIHVLKAGPAEKAGLVTGDKIIKVNNTPIAGNNTTTDRIQELLRGTDGSSVNVTVMRNHKQQQFTIKRGEIPIYSIDASYMINNNIGYIKINKFAANTYQEFMDDMLTLQKEGMKKLIIDLRDNPGGFMDAAINLADELLSDRKLILYTQGSHYPRTNYYCQKPGIFEKGPLAILVNEGSASASEILAGAIQDWDRGVIIGRRTFGKGLVQEQYSLNDGGALRLTIARYYMPSGRCIQKPYNDGIQAYDEDLMDRYNDGELLSKDSIKITDSTPYYTMIKHRVVYGGGGIIPDIFIPYDTVKFNMILSHLYAANTFGEFAYVYYEAHPKEFSAYKSPEDFNNQFQLTNAVYNNFLQFAAKDTSLDIHQLNDPDAIREIKHQVKAFLARQIWQSGGYYIVNNSTDPAVEKAVEVLSKEKVNSVNSD
jgi:carboxyl-terminal processing protease